MIGGNELLERIRKEFPGTTTRQVFPFLRVRVVTARFKDTTEDEREGLLAEAVSLDLAALRSTAERLFLRFELLAEEQEDPTPLPVTGTTWLGTFADGPHRFDPVPGTARVVHFYGFKGGQGRSTLLAFAAHDLARTGLRVLAVDLDAEAPSLDLVFGVGAISPEATLVGLRAGLNVTPIVVKEARGGGSVSLLAFRPSDSAFDMDSTALAFETAVHAPSGERLALELRRGMARNFDVVMFDHRTGLGATVPLWVRLMPGPVLGFDRLDGQSGRATRDVERIWTGLENPGLLVSYVPPTLSPEAFRRQSRGDAWPWLDALARAKSERADRPLGPEDVEDHWILWPDDNAFRRRGLPQRDEVGGLTLESLARMRELVGLKIERKGTVPPQLLHPSGAADQGLFIATEALRQLSQPGSTIRYILGRKGTGKTRLLSELVRRGVGEPLVVAEDERAGGLPSGDIDLKALVTRAVEQSNHEGVWWTLLRAALTARTTKSDALRQALQSDSNVSDGIDVRATARVAQDGARVFLVDGLETMLPRSEAQELIQGLLRVASALEQDSVFRSRVSLRIFLRSDIARWGLRISSSRVMEKQSN